ncbi:MAG: hypothetical protein MUF12_03720 [Sediminibacterium sp.]|nr:hypothetical protein [Hydrotalea sp.]MCU0336948.1 hypothetical protein [Sediminibacterium sp.]
MKKVLLAVVFICTITGFQACTKKDFPVPQDTAPAPPSSPSVPAPPTM